MTITAGTTVQFTRWQALGWTAPPAPFKVVDTRGEGDHLELFDGERWGPAKHYEPVVGDPEPDYGRIAWAAATGMEARRYDGSHHAWDDAAAAVIAAYRAAHPEPAMSRGEAWLDGYEVGEAEGYGRGQTDARAAHPEPQPARIRLLKDLHDAPAGEYEPLGWNGAFPQIASTDPGTEFVQLPAVLWEPAALAPAAGVQEPTPERPPRFGKVIRRSSPEIEPILATDATDAPVLVWPHNASRPAVTTCRVYEVVDDNGPDVAFIDDNGDEQWIQKPPVTLWAPAVPPVSAPEPEPAPTSPLAFMDRCPTCDLPAEGAPDGAQVCSDGFHRAAAPELTPDRPAPSDADAAWTEHDSMGDQSAYPCNCNPLPWGAGDHREGCRLASPAAAPAPSPDRPTKRPRPVRLFPGQELTVAAPSPDPERPMCRCVPYRGEHHQKCPAAGSPEPGQPQ